ncbi:OLC1v1033470C1 [Oldenlandia corymbosa var. corymbosa]|uniref:OLC1v1033470C1 n=1 Tax=Oldenlandia corymbosa var. corymbosa TaxID=529605 RepID=A0AAV1CN94_OLDCO|nr:OLC1v1033470C1 [Oldenlandia corymbosa var. corymbosa]
MPEFLSRVNEFLHHELEEEEHHGHMSFEEQEQHHDQMSFEEPAVKTSVKGRPKANIPHKWCYWEKYTVGSGRSHMSTSSPTYDDSREQRGWRTDFHSYQYRQSIPFFMVPFVRGYLDVRGDGNCGFRCVAGYIRNLEEDWPLVRTTIIQDLIKWPDLSDPSYYYNREQNIRRLR